MNDQDREPRKGRAGGHARAQALTAKERKEIAQRAALARWEGNVPEATHFGEIRIGTTLLPCAVLPDGIRVISQGGVANAFGPAKGGWHKRKHDAGEDSGGLPPFLIAANLQPFISDDLRTVVTSPRKYRDPRGGPIRLGLEATFIPKVCEVWLRARDAGVLTKAQGAVAERADTLMRGLAHTGIIALVDEATGYQYDRAKDDLMRILEAYISKALLPWTERFPAAFFKEIYRLHGWQFKEGKTRGPRMIGHLINKLIYEQLPPGVLDDLKRKNPIVYPGSQRKYKHHQWLTDDVGNPHLTNQVSQVLGVMRASETKGEFKRLFERAFPKGSQQLSLPIPEDL